MPVSRPPGTLDTREDSLGWLCLREPLPRVCALISPWCPPRLHTRQQLGILLPIKAERTIALGKRVDTVIGTFAKIAKRTFTKLHFKLGALHWIWELSFFLRQTIKALPAWSERARMAHNDIFHARTLFRLGLGGGSSSKRARIAL